MDIYRKETKINLFQFWVVFLIFFVVSLLIRLLASEKTRETYFHSNTEIVGGIYRSIAFWNERVLYYDENQILKDENQRLKNDLFYAFLNEKQEDSTVFPTPYNILTTASVIVSPIYKSDNFLVLNVGKNKGVEKEMAVVEKGRYFVGKIFATTDNFSKVLPILNQKLQVSAKVKTSNFNLGIINWDGDDYRYVNIDNIPFYENVDIGDTVVTTGYSATIPPNLLVGEIISKEQGEDEYNLQLKVKLFADYKKLHRVEIIKNDNKEELESFLNQ